MWPKAHGYCPPLLFTSISSLNSEKCHFWPFLQYFSDGFTLYCTVLSPKFDFQPRKGQKIWPKLVFEAFLMWPTFETVCISWIKILFFLQILIVLSSYCLKLTSKTIEGSRLWGLLASKVLNPLFFLVRVPIARM